MKKIALLSMGILLTVMMVLLGSCNQSENEESLDTGSNTSATDPAVAKLTVPVENYSVVGPRKLGEFDKTSVAVVRNYLKKVSGADMIPYEDAVAGTENADQYEVIVGNTGRKESDAFLSELGFNQYGFTVTEKQLFCRLALGTLESRLSDAHRRGTADVVSNHRGIPAGSGMVCL